MIWDFKILSLWFVIEYWWYNTLTRENNWFLNVLVKSNFATPTPFGSTSCFVIGICLSNNNLNSFLIHQVSYSKWYQWYLMHREVMGNIWKIGRYPIKVSEVLWLWSTVWSQRYLCLKVKTDGRLLESHPISSPRAFCSGELKTFSNINLLLFFSSVGFKFPVQNIEKEFLIEEREKMKLINKWNDKNKLQEGQGALNRSNEFCLELTYIHICWKLSMSLVTPGGLVLAQGAKF